MKILLIEDDIEAAGYLAQGLRENGHQVDVAHTGDQGLQLALEESFDVLIVDRMLPELDGLTVLSRLREIARPAAQCKFGHSLFSCPLSG